MSLTKGKFKDEITKDSEMVTLALNPKNRAHVRAGPVEPAQRADSEARSLSKLSGGEETDRCTQA